MREMRAAGVSLRKIGDEFDLTASHVLYHVRDIPSVNTHPPGRPRAFSHERAQRLRADGFTYAEIAERMGVSRPAVYFACKRKTT